MTLIKSISGIRGTIGGHTGDTLNPLDIVKFTTAYATFMKRNTKSGTGKIVVGRDARISGEMVKDIVCGTLMGMGYDVVNIGLATTPTTELAVSMLKADGGIIITASHNPRQWNALKLLNAQGEFLTKADGNEVLKIAEEEDFEYADVDHLGHYSEDNSFNQNTSTTCSHCSWLTQRLYATLTSKCAPTPSTAWEVSSCHSSSTLWEWNTTYSTVRQTATLPTNPNHSRKTWATSWHSRQKAATTSASL